MITKKMRKYSSWQLLNDQPYFINGIIRKYKPKKCLELGVAAGGSSIVILNAIKDIKDSFLISLDVNTQLYCDKKFKTGYSVYKYFPELTKKWKLYTGEQSYKFLDKLNLKFDFLLLDTVHFSPGELINIIEVLPFLEDNAIIVLHDIMFHLPSNNYLKPKRKKFHPSNIYLMIALFGDKVILENKNKKIENIGAIHLYPNQKKYYLNYFLLLMSPWEYMPNEKYIQELREFIKKYYKEEIYLNLFNKAVEENYLYVNF
jgi:predicted O-methyltransferase YrrM